MPRLSSNPTMAVIRGTPASATRTGIVDGTKWTLKTKVESAQAAANPRATSKSHRSLFDGRAGSVEITIQTRWAVDSYPQRVAGSFLASTDRPFQV